jgi:hypothetical protein
MRSPATHSRSGTGCSSSAAAAVKRAVGVKPK